MYTVWSGHWGHLYVILCTACCRYREMKGHPIRDRQVIHLSKSYSTGSQRGRSRGPGLLARPVPFYFLWRVGVNGRIRESRHILIPCPRIVSLPNLTDCLWLWYIHMCPVASSRVPAACHQFRHGDFDYYKAIGMPQGRAFACHHLGENRRHLVQRERPAGES